MPSGAPSLVVGLGRAAEYGGHGDRGAQTLREPKLAPLRIADGPEF